MTKEDKISEILENECKILAILEELREKVMELNYVPTI